MSEFACRKHGYHDETKMHSCTDCYADWLAAKPKSPPARVQEQTFICGDFCCIRNSDYSHDALCPGPGKVFGVDPKDPFGPRDADGWYEWKGDDMVRPAGRVDVLLRDCKDVHTWNADSISWARAATASPGDVMKWRPAQ